MYGGRIRNGEIEYRENSEKYPKDGFFEHEDFDVLKFIMEDKLILEKKEPGEYSFSKDHPGHIEKWTLGKGEKYDSLADAVAAREAYWSNYWEDLSPFDEEIVTYLITGMTKKDLEEIESEPGKGGVIIN